jgi:hypothetical protein
VLLEMGGFSETESMGEDLDLWARIALRYPLACTDRVLAVYYRDDTRDWQRLRKKWPYPPELRSLRAAISAGGVEPARLARLKHYVDFHAMENLWWQLRLAVPSAGEAIRGERFYGLRYRFEAACLRAAHRVLPTRLIVNLRCRPVQLIQFLRRLFRPQPAEVVGRLVARRKLGLKPPA